MKVVKEFFSLTMILSLMMGLNTNGVSQVVDTAYISKTIKPISWLGIPVLQANDIKGSLHQYTDTTDLEKIPLRRLNNGFLVNLTDAFDDGNNIYKTYQYTGDGTTNDFPNDWNEVMLINPWRPNTYIEAGRLVVFVINYGVPFSPFDYYVCHTGHTSSALFDNDEKGYFTSLINENDWIKDGDDLYNYPDSTISILNQKVGISIKKDLNYELNLKGRIWMENDAKSIIIGDSAGFALDQSSARNSVLIGSQAGKRITTGMNNIAIGANNTLTSNTTGEDNVAIGSSVLTNSTTANNNIAIGSYNLQDGNMQAVTGDNNVAIGNYILSNNIGGYNIGIGDSILHSNTTGIYNIGMGKRILRFNTIGEYNIGMGVNALYGNTTGKNNVAVGTFNLENTNTASNNIAIGSNNLQYGSLETSTGDNNVAIGSNVLRYNTGKGNIGIGDSILYNNTTGVYNTGIGLGALHSNTSGNYNIGLGLNALYNNTTGENNVAIGLDVLKSSTTASNNIAIGNSSLKYANLLANTGDNNVGIGLNVLQNNTGKENIGIGSNVLMANTTGVNNIGIGLDALKNNTTGFNNIGMGMNTLMTNTTENNNIGVGVNSLKTNTGGTINIGIGVSSLQANTDGDNNIGIGDNTLFSNTTGSGNIGIGNQALYSNTTGSSNIAIGLNALRSNTIASNSVAIGVEALMSNRVQGANSRNIAIGSRALKADTTGMDNTAIGYESLKNLITNSNSNTAVGSSSLSNLTSGDSNVAIGMNAGRYYGPSPGTLNLTNISKSVFLGAETRASANNSTNEIVIGYQAVGYSANSVRIGNSDIKRIEGQVGWSFTSDRRLKKNIESLDSGLDFILKLKPVSYIRKNNPDEEIEFGFIAQDLRETLIHSGYKNHGMVSGKETETTFLSLRSDDIIAPLVKSIQETNLKLNNEIEQNKKLEQIIEEVVRRIEKLEQQE